MMSGGYRILKPWYHREKTGGRSAGERNLCEVFQPKYQNHLGASGGGHGVDAELLGDSGASGGDFSSRERVS